MPVSSLKGGPTGARGSSLSQSSLLALATLVAFNLRSVILAVPPVLPLIRRDLHLSFAAAGGLASLPVLCLGGAAIPGAVLANRLGAGRVMGLAMLGIGAGGLLRLGLPSLPALFLGTLGLSLCAAVAQPAASAFLRAWFPGSLQRASVIYTTGLNAGGMAAVTLTGYLLVVGSWRGTFVLWSLPALAVGVLWFRLAPRGPLKTGESRGFRRLLRDLSVWRAASLFAAQSLVYYTAVTWIPFLLQEEGSHATSLVLLSLGLAVLVLGLTLALARLNFATSAALYIGAGVVCLLGSLGFVVGPIRFAWLFALLAGVGSGLTFAGSMALPPLLARSAGEVAAYSSLMLTAGYVLAFFGPFTGGLLVDATGRLTSPFWLLILASLAMIVLGVTFRSRPEISGRG